MPWDERDNRKKKQRVDASQAAADERHRGFDLSAKDNHAKSERPSFIPNAGMGDKVAQELYRQNYDQINWRN